MSGVNCPCGSPGTVVSVQCLIAAFFFFFRFSFAAALFFSLEEKIVLKKIGEGAAWGWRGRRKESERLELNTQDWWEGDRAAQLLYSAF